MNQRDIDEEVAYAEIARKDWERKIYEECDKEDKLKIEMEEN